MTGQADRISYSQISGTIGSMIWLWAEIERALAKAIEGTGGKVPMGIASKIEFWAASVRTDDPDRTLQNDICNRFVAHLARSLRLRNAICHGLTGITAQRGTEPAFLTVQLHGSEAERLEWQMLQEMFAWMSRSDGTIADLTRAARETDAGKSEADLQGWRVFPDIL